MPDESILSRIKSQAYMSDDAAIELCAKTGVSLDALCLLRLLSRKLVRQSHAAGYGDALGISSQA